MRHFLPIALLLVALPVAAETRCRQTVLGNWQCDQGGAPSFQLQKSSFMPGVWHTYPAPGSRAPACEIRRTFTGDYVTQCQ
jgi:hypothetical protein